MAVPALEFRFAFDEELPGLEVPRGFTSGEGDQGRNEKYVDSYFQAEWTRFRKPN